MKCGGCLFSLLLDSELEVKMDAIADFVLELNDSNDPEIRDCVQGPLLAHSAMQIGKSSLRNLNVLLRGPFGQVRGGLLGHTSGGWLTIELVYLPQSLRGRGVGRSLVEYAESEAGDRGCHHAWLDTAEFQARGFFEAIGYACFGQLSDFPQGQGRYFMSKRLRPGGI